MAERATILLVDDAEDVRKSVRRLLEAEGYHVIEAGNGRDGLHALYDARPDLVMLDVNMPDMDGWETLERMRELTTVPVLMLSARGTEGDKVHGLRRGADDYVVKPFSPAELFARVEALLRRSRAATPAAEPPKPRPAPRPHQPKDPW